MMGSQVRPSTLHHARMSGEAVYTPPCQDLRCGHLYSTVPGSQVLAVILGHTVSTRSQVTPCGDRPFQKGASLLSKTTGHCVGAAGPTLRALSLLLCRAPPAFLFRSVLIDPVLTIWVRDCLTWSDGQMVRGGQGMSEMMKDSQERSGMVRGG